jgi:hypothetical protein
MTELEEYQLKVNKYVHDTFADAYKLITQRTIEQFSDLSDGEKHLIIQRIVNRLYIQFNTVTFNKSFSESLRDGDLK